MLNLLNLKWLSNVKTKHHYDCWLHFVSYVTYMEWSNTILLVDFHFMAGRWKSLSWFKGLNEVHIFLSNDRVNSVQNAIAHLNELKLACCCSFWQQTDCWRLQLNLLSYTHINKSYDRMIELIHWSPIPQKPDWWLDGTLSTYDWSSFTSSVNDVRFPYTSTSKTTNTVSQTIGRW